jgi:hypothetical protein
LDPASGVFTVQGVGLAVLPGSALFADSAPGNYVRVPFTAPPATLSKAAALLKAAHANLA